MKKTLTLLSLLALAGGASAQSTWTLGNGDQVAPVTTCQVTGSGNASIIDNCGTTGLNSAGVKFDAIGVSLSTSAGTFARSTLTNQGTNGIGSDESTGEVSPAHAFDNLNGENTEMLFLSFDSAVRLSGVGVGYVSGDADISVYKWVGTAPNATQSNLTGLAAGALPAAPASFDVRSATTSTASNGWILVKSSDLAAAGDSMSITATSNVSASSWWLISAFLGSTGVGDDASSKVTDYFKLLTVSACTSANPQTGACGPGTGTGVPEPMSAALVMLALVGGAGVRRLNKRA